MGRFFPVQLLADVDSYESEERLLAVGDGTPPVRVLTHLLAGLSVSNTVRTDLPSMSGGGSRPAMSRMVGARSMFSTM